MKIGILYDTRDMYTDVDGLYYDFANEVSISQLDTAFKNLGYETVRIKSISALLKMLLDGKPHCDLFYNTMEGISSRNREGFAPSLLEMFQAPYMGTDAFGLSLALNKYLTKIIAKNYGIATPKSTIIAPCDSIDMIHERIKIIPFPHMIKPNYEGNSSGISRCVGLDESAETIFRLSKLYKSEILCEEFIFGKELTIPYIGNDFNNAMWAITTVDVQDNDDFWLDKYWKTIGDYHNTICMLPEEVTEKIGYAISTLFRVLGCKDFCRFDFRLSSDGCPYFIEANPLPALFNGGSFDVMGQEHGMVFSETIKRIINTSLDRLSIPST